MDGGERAFPVARRAQPTNRRPDLDALRPGDARIDLLELRPNVGENEKRPIVPTAG